MNIESLLVSTYTSSKGVITEITEQNIYAACRVMSENNIGCVIIVDKNHVTKPLGIITERGVVRILGTLNQIFTDTPLGNIMSKPLVTISTDCSVKDAIQTMQRKNIRRLVIVEKERMVGIITDKDIFKAIVNNQDLLLSLLNDELIREHKTTYEQFGRYWFTDIFHKQ